MRNITIAAAQMGPIQKEENRYQVVNRMIKLMDDAKKTSAVIGYNYPKSKWYKHSYELVVKNNEKKSLLNFFKKKK